MVFGPGLALGAVFAICGYAIVGPTGLLAWTDYQAQLDKRKAQLHELDEQRLALENRVRLLDPNGVDPDLASELVRRELNVAHPDEIVISVK